MSNARTKHYDPPVPFERLQELIAALESDDPLDRTTRNEIRDALDCLFVTQLIEEKGATPGRRVSSMQRYAAYLVHHLVSEHGVSVKAAVIAVLPGATVEKEIERLARAYRKLKADDGFRVYREQPLQEHVAAALARIRKSGNK